MFAVCPRARARISSGASCCYCASCLYTYVYREGAQISSVIFAAGSEYFTAFFRSSKEARGFFVDTDECRTTERWRIYVRLKKGEKVDRTNTYTQTRRVYAYARAEINPDAVTAAKFHPSIYSLCKYRLRTSRRGCEEN